MLSKLNTARTLHGELWKKLQAPVPGDENRITRFVAQYLTTNRWQEMTDHDLDVFIAWMRIELDPPEPLKTIYNILLAP